MFLSSKVFDNSKGDNSTQAIGCRLWCESKWIIISCRSGSPDAGHVPPVGGSITSISRPPRVDEVCDFDGTPLIIREDDRDEVIKERLATYERQTRPVAEYYKARGGCFPLTGTCRWTKSQRRSSAILKRTATARRVIAIRMPIVCKSAAEIEKMRRSGRVVREVLNHLARWSRRGSALWIWNMPPRRRSKSRRQARV